MQALGVGAGGARGAARGLQALLLGALAAAGSAAALSFEDAQGEAGIDFTHTGDGLFTTFIGVVGSGACWGDLDGDGLPDAVLVNQRYRSDDDNDRYKPTTKLFLNNGDGTFQDATNESGLRRLAWRTGCSLADYDGDGDLDLLETAYGHVVLWRNEGGAVFANATSESGIDVAGKCGAIPCWGTSSAWADYDRDGDLDLYITNYVAWDINDEEGEQGPGPYEGQTNLLWENNGDGTFTDVTAATNADDDPGPRHSKAFQAVWFDHDADGWPDLYIASDGTENSLLHNRPNGTERRFEDIARSTGVADARASMGLDIADEGHDGLADLYMTHFALEHNGFYRGTPFGIYEDHSGEGELANDWNFVGWGTGFHDFDNDGDTDIYAVNGHTAFALLDSRMKPLLFLQGAGGAYADASRKAGPSFANASTARGSAVADYDSDGDLDILLNNAYNETARLFKNQGPVDNWLQLELRQPGMNSRAVGAAAIVTLPDGKAMWRTVKAGNSYMSQDWDTLHWGLGTAASVSLEVRWPDGTSQSFPSVEANQRIRLTKGAASLVNDTVSPRTSFDLLGPRGRAGWFTGDVTVTLDAVDRGVTFVSGVARLEARLDAAPWGDVGRTVLVQGDGGHTLAVRAHDYAGNPEPVRLARIPIDGQPPATTLGLVGAQGSNGWFRGPVELRFVAQDATSGVERTELRVNGGEWRAVPPYAAPHADSRFLDKDGVHLAEYRSVDVAGNIEPIQSAVVKIDQGQPRLAALPGLAVPGLWGQALALAGDDVSGMARVEFYLDEEEMPRHTILGARDVYAWDLSQEPLAPGLHRLRVRALDAAGNEAVVEAPLLVAPGPAAQGPAAGSGVADAPRLPLRAPPRWLAGAVPR